MNYPLLLQAALITLSGVLGFIGFAYLVEKYPNLGAVTLLTGVFGALTALIYLILVGDA